MAKIKTIIAAIAMLMAIAVHAQTFRLNADGYFNAGGTDVMAFSDFYPEGHQGGSTSTINSALDFILGCHPGSNTASFASGVGARSATVAYGLNRADWSYIPGGVVADLRTIFSWF